jgi:hypothetical protein
MRTRNLVVDAIPAIAIAIAGVLGFAVGYLPWVLTDAPESGSGFIGHFDSFLRAALLVGFGSLLLPIVPAAIVTVFRSD